MTRLIRESEARIIFEADRKFHLHSFYSPKLLKDVPTETFVESLKIARYF